MGTSILTNTSSMAALQTLQSISEQLDTTQNRISSGMKVASASDNAAYWSIATTMKSDNKSLSAVSDALGLGASTVDVAYTGMNSVISNLDDIKSALVSAKQPGVDKSKIQTQIASLQQTIRSTADTATFSGSNWLSINSADADSTKQSVVSSLSRDSNGQISLGTIEVDTTQTALFDSNVDGAGLLDKGIGNTSTGSVGDVDGTAGADAVDAADVAAGTITSENAIDYTGTTATDHVKFTVSDGTDSVDVDVAIGASVDDLVSNLNDDTGFSDKFTASKDADGKLVLTTVATGASATPTISGVTYAADAGSATTDLNFSDTDTNVASNGSGSAASSITSENVLDYTDTVATDHVKLTVSDGTTDTAVDVAIGSDVDDLVANLNADTGFSASYVASNDGSGKLVISTIANSDADLTLSDVSYTGDPTAAAAKALNFSDTDANVTVDGTDAVDAADATKGTAVMANAFNAASPISLDDNDTISFDIAVDGGTAKTVTISKDTIANTEGLTTDGKISSADDMQKVLTQALSDAGIDGVTVSAPTSGDNSGKIVFTSDSDGATSDVDISNSAASNGNAFSLMDLDITDATSDELDTYINGVDKMIQNVTSAASTIGATKTQISDQTDFLSSLMDSIDTGVGRLVDADMNKESTKLKALQTQQQLGIQALSIANSNSQNILSLFR